MKNITDFSDRRNKSWCIHCGRWLSDVTSNRDHVPSTSLLSKPYPEQLPVVQICMGCNVGFSSDEQYLVAFLGAVLAGSTDPTVQGSEVSRRALANNPKLRARIERSKTEYRTMGGETRCVWKPEQKRIDRIVVKNARGHAFFEIGEPMLDKPDHIWTWPIESMTLSELDQFESPGEPAFWPEVGSRMMTRLAIGDDVIDGWVIVQDSVYRYRVDQDGGVRVRTVVAGYLATEVVWN